MLLQASIIANTFILSLARNIFNEKYNDIGKILAYIR